LKNPRKKFKRLWRDLTSHRRNRLFRKIYQRIRGRIPFYFKLHTQKTPILDAKQEFLTKSGSLFDEFLFTEQRLRFNSSEKPTLSIVLILWNKCELTYMCLRSLLNLNASQLAFEIIIIDNDSKDRTRTMLDRIDGIRVHYNAKNLGFLKACNQALELVRGEELLFLNNDTEVHPGAIEAAVETLRANPTHGAVGARIILPSGVLQEAGNIMWNDGTCLGYARGYVPHSPEVMFQRETDYCSGAFLLTRTRLFQETGGFDERYLPAYYEETDYCMELRKRGFKIIYEPRSVINHFEFGSAELSSKAMETMGRNRLKFLDKHREFLASFPKPSTNLLNFRLPRTAKRILYIEDRVPHLDHGAGFPRSNKTLSAIAELGYDVSLYPTFEPPEAWSTVYRDMPRNVEVVLNKFFRGLPQFLKERENFYDLIWVCRPHNMHFLITNCPELFSNSKVRIVYDAEALFSERMKLEAKIRPVSPKEIQKAVHEEYGIAEKVSHIVSVSHYEADLWRKNVKSAPITVLGHDYSCDPSPISFSERRDFVFFGSLHGKDSPNADSLFWFLDTILPQINARLKEKAKLAIVGHSYLSPRLFEKYEDEVELVGTVQDLKQELGRYRVMVIPTRFAAGLPQKAFDAAKYGIPTVCTDLIANQMGWQHGAETLCSPIEDSHAFARNCVDLYEDEQKWTSIRSASLKYMDIMGRSDSGLKAGIHAILQKELSSAGGNHKAPEMQLAFTSEAKS
jgi:GT2 family glycosyltransferase